MIIRVKCEVIRLHELKNVLNVRKFSVLCNYKKFIINLLFFVFFSFYYSNNSVVLILFFGNVHRREVREKLGDLKEIFQRFD